jgi:hypothetical protein
MYTYDIIDETPIANIMGDAAFVFSHIASIIKVFFATLSAS